MSIATITIYVDGEKVGDFIYIRSVTIEQRVDLVDKAEVVAGEDGQTGMPFSIFNSNQFKEGKTITILIGYLEGGQVIFEGVIPDNRS